MNRKHSIWNKFIFMVMVILCLSMTACTDVDGDLMTEKEVLEKVAAQVQGEKYELISVAHFTEELPKRDVYTFKSKDRDMTFTATSTLGSVGIDASTIGYEQRVYVGYAEGVQTVYEEQMENLLGELPRNGKGHYLYESFADLSALTERIMEVEELYREELKYNTADWMIKNPLTRIGVAYSFVDPDGEERDVLVYTVPINGAHEAKELYDLIAYNHVEKVKQGLIVDNTTPQEQLDRFHEEKLPNVFVGDVNVADEAFAAAKGQNLINNSREMYSCYYYYPWDSYVMMLNVGLVEEDYAPKLVESYAEALHYSCFVDYGKGEIEWYNGPETVTLHAKKDADGRISFFTAYKGGEALNVPYITSKSEQTVVRGTYLVGISVDDFAKLFDVTYTIDEESGEIRFTK